MNSATQTQLPEPTKMKPQTTSLVEMFNSDIDFVRYDKKTEIYYPVEEIHKATHRLEATSWNTPEKHVQKSCKLRKLCMPKGYALSVCALSLVKKKRRTSIIIKRKIPSTFPDYYNVEGAVEGKKKVIRGLCKATGAAILAKVKAADTDECDKIYLGILKASYNKANRKHFK